MFVSDLIIPLTVEEVYCTGRRTINPRTGEVIEDAVSNRPIFRAVEAVERGEVLSGGRAPSAQGDSDAVRRAARRACKQLFELAVCNEFQWFVTLTLDRKEVDRKDYKAVINKMNRWLDNLVRRHGFAYIIVPELHKDGALHFHGLVKEDGLRLASSGHRDKSGREIFNVLNWRYGFTTAVRLTGDYGNVCRYITKYIRKGMDGGTICGRYFYRGGELQKPWHEYYNANFDECEGKVVEIEGCGLKICYR